MRNGPGACRARFSCSASPSTARFLSTICLTPLRSARNMMLFPGTGSDEAWTRSLKRQWVTGFC